MAGSLEKIPVNVVTGFLGSGKTTLLQRVLQTPEFADTAVLINELGEVGLDHHLLEEIDENILLLQNGCVCCTIRSDLKDAIRDLHSRRSRGLVPPFRRLVIETTGLADPTPILATIALEPVIHNHFRLGNVIVTVDALNALLLLARQPESLKQIAVADRIILTKTDLAALPQIEAVKTRLRRLNPSAPLIETGDKPVDPAFLLAHDLHDSSYLPNEVRRWQEVESHDGDTIVGGVRSQNHQDLHDTHRHDNRIAAFALTFDEPMDWTAFGIWLTMLLQSHGEDVLRVKGMLNVAGVGTPVVIHGVQHIVHPPVHMTRWPDEDRRSRIVFIVRDIAREEIERSLMAFNRVARDYKPQSHAA